MTTINFLKSFIVMLRPVTNVLSRIDSVNTILKLDSIKYIYKGQIFVNEYGFKFTVLKINCDKKEIEIKTTNEPITTIIFEYPKFFYGTVIDFNNEVVHLNFKDKLPCIYLHERFDENIGGIDAVYERSGTYDLYFLTDADFAKWDNDKFQNMAIEPMGELASMFVREIRESSSNVVKISDYKQGNRQRFASYIDSKGEIKKDVSDSLSGVKITMDLKFIKKNCNC
jgi:hypothetical protein